MPQNAEKKTNQAYLLIILTAIGYSTAGVAFKFVNWNPLVIGAVRGVIVLFCHGCYLGSFKISLNLNTIAGALIFYFATTSFIIANKLTSSANAIVLQYTNPIFIVLISWIFLRQRLRKKDISMIALITVGVILFFVDDLSPGHMAGNMIAIISGIFMALGTIYSKYTKENIQHSYMLSNIIGIIIGIPFLWIYPPALTVQSVTAVFILGTVSLGIPQILFAKGIRHVLPVEASILLMLDPIFNPIFVALLVGELPGRTALCGAAVVISSVVYWCITANK